MFALDEQAGQFCVEVFFFRNWQNWGNRAYFPKAHKSMPPGEVLASFLAQFYDDKPAPRLILVSHEIEDCELLAAALSTRAEARVEIHVREARRAPQPRRLRAAQRPRGAGAAACRHRLAAEAPDLARPGLRARETAAAHRRVRQLAHHGHERGRRHDRRRTCRAHEAALPDLQHQVRGARARRRLRHDARGAAPALLEAGRRRRRGRKTLSRSSRQRRNSQALAEREHSPPPCGEGQGWGAMGRTGTSPSEPCG